MTQIKDVTRYLEIIAPTYLQEDYDNTGLLTGNPSNEVSGILITLDCTEDIVQEAIKLGCNLIVAHHPIIFRGLKNLTGKTYIERTIILAIKNDISIYAIHTNLDNVSSGVNRKIADKIGLENLEILSPKPGQLMKITSYVPSEHTNKVIKALNDSGAGNIGNYENCSFRVTGTGTFQPNDSATPHIGKKGQLEEVIEDRIELIFPNHLKNKILNSLKSSHPYEEVAYYLHQLENLDQDIGSGMIGTLPTPMEPEEFLLHLKNSMELNTIRYTHGYRGEIKRIAICGGSGSFLLKKALQMNADAFVSADFKYHEFFDAEDQLMITDIGHYESEVCTKDLIYGVLSEKFTKFALHLSKVVTNPISYF